MTRTIITILALTAVTGCFVVRHDPGEPIDGMQTMQPATTRTGSPWRRPDSMPASAVAAGSANVSPTAPIRAVSARLPEKAPTEGPSLAADQTLVRDTWTQAPGNQPQPVGPELEAPGTKPMQAASGHSNPVDIGALLPPAGCTASNTPIASGTGTTLRLVNSKRIVFGYEVKDGANSTPVEVWGTQDLKVWKKYNTVPHKGHGCVVEVKEEGLYGFVLRAGEATHEAPPAAEMPQVWVAVDVTRPTVQLLPAEMNETGKAPVLVVHWSAQDKNLGVKPVTLSWAEKSEGPWTTIAANIENTGRYEWTLAHGLPSAVHIRVQAADLMGNVGTAQTTNRLVLPRPAGEIAGAPQLEMTASYEPDRRPPAQPRLVTLPPTPPIEMPRLVPPAPVPAKPRPQVSILSVEPEKN